MSAACPHHCRLGLLCPACSPPPAWRETTVQKALRLVHQIKDAYAQADAARGAA